uniref:Uncharacterized protein LOC101510669 n=2 Tax=Cicer arietinum TaxID=3827 RepID=A0A1S2Z0Y0_CICAR|nr:uncharacterized protein LOC101510669 [Cicer arietinum]
MDNSSWNPFIYPQTPTPPSQNHITNISQIQSNTLSQQKKKKHTKTHQTVTKMEIETNQSIVAKKVWKTIRIILFMLRKVIAKSKVISELNLLVKRGKIAAVKAITNALTLRHYSSAAVSSFVSPHDYDFSCSNSPTVIKFHNKKKNNHHRYHHHQCHDVSTVQKVLEILNDMETSSFSSPSPLVALSGFDKSPIGKKQLRITDSPFPLKEEEGEDYSHVDIAAEEFIKRFYKNLNLQKELASIQSPYHNSWNK